MKEEMVWKYFVHNDKSFTRQTAVEGQRKPNYYKVDEKLSKLYVKKHLEGTQTIGVFPVLDGRTKWLCIDIDINKEIYEAPGWKWEDNAKEVDAIAEAIKAKLALKDIKSYKESSGGKGMHVWVFFDPPVPVSLVTRVFPSQIKSISYDKTKFNVEYFPNSEQSKSVKLPGGFNPTFGRWSNFEIPLDKIEIVSQKVLMDISNAMEAVFTRCRAFRELKEKADVERHLRHKERSAIASMGYHLDKQYVDFIENYYFRDLENYNEELTKKNLKDYNESYRPVRCDKLIEDGICSGKCQEIKNGKSPIAFFHEELRESKGGSTGDSVIIDPQDNLVKRNNNFYEKSRNNELVLIANYVIDITAIEEIIDDDNDCTEKILKGNLTTYQGEEYPFSIPFEDYHKNEALISKIYDTLRLGGSNFVSPRKIEQIRQCIDKFSKPVTIKKTRNFGFNRERTVYYSPTVRIDKDSIMPNNDIAVDVGAASGELEQYFDLALDHPLRGEEYWKDWIKNTWTSLYINKTIPTIVLSHLMELLIKPAFGALDNDSPYILWLAGESGIGKSRLIVVAQRLFGKYPKSYSFTSSPGRIEFSGYFYRDALYAVDDYKTTNLSDYQKGTLMAVLQNYADKTGRSRLTRDISAQKSYWVRGNFLINGEDMITQEGSNIARTVVFNMTRKDVNIDYELYEKIQTESLNIGELTPHIIQWAMNQDMEAIAKIRQDQQFRLHKLGKNYPNAARIITNYSKFITSGFCIIDYLYGDTTEAKELKKAFQNQADDMFKQQLKLISEENVAGKFWNTMIEMISTNRIRICGSNIVTDDDKRPIVGFVHKGDIFIIHMNAFKFVTEFLSKTNPLNHSSGQVGRDLHSHGYYTTNESFKRYFNGKQVRVFQVNTEQIKELKADIENGQEKEK